MKFGFVTCVQLGLSCIEAIYEVGGKLDLLLTLPDDRARQKSGRIYLDDFARRHAVPLVKVRHINDPASLVALADARLDWLFIIGWSQIAGPEVLAMPGHGVIGMHPTLLPEGRGRAAIPWAILKRLERTGVTMFRMDEGVDTGDIIAQIEIPMRPNVDAGELYDAVDAAHVTLMKQAFPQLAANAIALREQDEARATVWPGRKPEDGRIDLSGSVRDAECLVRAVSRPYPGAFFDEGGRRTIVWKAELAETDRSLINEAPVLQFHDGTLRLIETEQVPLPDGST